MELRFQDELVYELFDCLGDIVFCAKDCEGRYVYVNDAFVESAAGFDDSSEIIGRRAADVFPSDLAKLYAEQDKTVLQSGAALRDQLDLVPKPNGTTGWYLSNKFPIVNDNGDIAGIASMSQDLATPSDSDLELTELKAIVEYIHCHIAKHMKTEDLAKQIGLSPTQLDRRMKRVFRLSTKKFIIKCRLERASNLLVTTQDSLANIALSCGFSDQSSFCRQFREAAKQTPSLYRKTHQDQ